MSSITFVAKLIIDTLGIDVELYCASEVDQDAIKVSGNRHGSTIEYLGNIIDIVKDDDLIKSKCPIHLLVGGSPCEELSRANKDGLGLGNFLMSFVLSRRSMIYIYIYLTVVNAANKKLRRGLK